MTKVLGSSNNRIAGLLMILGLFVILMPGCQQINDAVNKPANSNSTANSNASTNANANSNVTASSNASANSSALPTEPAANTNNQASNSAANTATATKEQVPLTEEAKVFKNDLVGKWTDGNETLTFTENKIESSQTRGKTHTYRVVDEKTIEATQDWNGTPWKATMKIEDNGNSLLWYNETQKKNFKYTRVK
ncbi:MAG: hypothetical protein IPJ30_03800 [Acidobacteria bacterium]|nr:hypothetical protein [Acidobacteriota bacterium]